MREGLEARKIATIFSFARSDDSAWDCLGIWESAEGNVSNQGAAGKNVSEYAGKDMV